MLCNWLTRQPLKLKFPVRVWVAQLHCCREELLHKMLIRTICQKILLSSVTWIIIVSYFSWLECHPDKMEVVGSSPIETTKNWCKDPYESYLMNAEYTWSVCGYLTNSKMILKYRPKWIMNQKTGISTAPMVLVSWKSWFLTDTSYTSW